MASTIGECSFMPLELRLYTVTASDPAHAAHIISDVWDRLVCVDSLRAADFYRTTLFSIDQVEESIAWFEAVPLRPADDTTLQPRIFRQYTLLRESFCGELPGPVQQLFDAFAGLNFAIGRFYTDEEIDTRLRQRKLDPLGAS